MELQPGVVQVAVFDSKNVKFADIERILNSSFL